MEADAVVDSEEGVVGAHRGAGIGEEELGGITGKLEMGEYVEEVAEDDLEIVVEEIVLVSFDEGLVEEVELQDGGEGKVSFDVVFSEHKSGGKGQDFSEIEEVEKVFIN